MGAGPNIMAAYTLSNPFDGSVVTLTLLQSGGFAPSNVQRAAADKPHDS
jgi:hypothetical protein